MNDTLTLEAIPHRPPFLFVDEIIEISEDRILTKKFVDPQADFFRGHYPSQPVMPGVLLCECCFQSGALLVAHRIRRRRTNETQSDRLENRSHINGVPVLTRITDARFKQIVRPGQTLHVEATLDDELDGAYFMTGRVTVNGKLALRVSFACMLTEDKDAADPSAPRTAGAGRTKE